MPLKKLDFAENIYWVFGILLDKKKGSAFELIKNLAKIGIGSRPFFYPIHKQPIFQKMGYFRAYNKRSTAEELYEQGLYLPSGLNLKSKEIKIVVEKLKYLLLN